MTATASGTSLDVHGNGHATAPTPKPHRRRNLIILGAVVVAIVVVIAAVVTRHNGSGSSNTAAAAPTTTAQVVRTNLAQTESIDGTLDYAPTRPIVNQISGTLTSRADDGSVVDRGGVLYSVDAKPVILMFGSMPAYRDMSTASTPGTDIAQLKQNLTALGYGALSNDDTFDSGTLSAVEKFESDRGLDGDGVVQLGEVMFAPSAVRVSGGPVDVGASVQPGTDVLDATATTKVVTASFTAAQASTAPVGTTVAVTLPDDSTTTGKIVDLSAAAASSSSSSGGGGGGGGGGGSSSGSFTATIDIPNTGIVPRVDSSTVSVTVVDQSKDNVLAVPVTALVALAEGGYAVQVVDNSPAGSHLVGVKTGMFTDSQVEVTGTGIAPGDRVVVPQ